MAETKAKANPDYSLSAMNLTNPPEVMDWLAKYHNEASVIAVIVEAIDKSIPQELKDRRAELVKLHQETEKALHQAIDEFGSYQDTEKGWYAIKQRRESITYTPELVKQYALPKVALFVVVEAVDSKALEALAKAGQITPATLRQCGEVNCTYAYIIK